VPYPLQSMVLTLSVIERLLRDYHSPIIPSYAGMGLIGLVVINSVVNVSRETLIRLTGNGDFNLSRRLGHLHALLPYDSLIGVG